MENLIIIIILTTWVSIVINILLKRLSIESIVWYIITWTIVSLVFDLQHARSGTLDMVAEFWIAFLMFSIGLEFSIWKLKAMKKEVFLYWWMQMLLTSSIFFLIAKYLLHVETKIAIIIGLALALSSTAIVLKLLNQSKKIYKKYGKNALGVLLFQDIAVIPIFILIWIFASDNGSIWTVMLKVSLSAMAILAIFFVWLKFVIPYILDLVAKTKSDEIFIASILFIVVWASQLAHSFGFSYSLWAFIAWLLISETKYKYQIEADLIPFRDLLLGVFFVTVGMQIDLFYIPWNIVNILLVLAVIISIKAFIIFIIMKVGFRTQTSLKTSIILAQVGEFSFAVFELAKINNLFLQESISQIIIVAIVFSMLLTPFIFKYLDTICWLFISELQDDISTKTGCDLYDHVIVCWYWSLWRKVVWDIKRIHEKYIVIEHDHNLVERWIKKGINIILWNSAKKLILEKLNITKARAVIIAIGKEDRLLMIAQTIRSISPDIKIIARVSSLYQKDQLNELWIDFIIDDIVETSHMIVEILKKKLATHI